MTKKIDIWNPLISTVTPGIEGKSILIYGDNSTGKTFQSTRAKKPFYLGFENGINAISGVPFAPIDSWVTFKQLNAQLTNPKTLDEAKERYQTIIFDEVFASALMCQQYICRQNGASHMGEAQQKGHDRPNLWTAYQNEYYTETMKLLKSGYTILFIGHQITDRDTGQIIPKGDVRSMEVIRDNADITAFLEPNGVDENGREIRSSAHFVQTPEFFARSRYDYMEPYLEEFTIEGLEKLVEEAVKKEEEVSGIKSISFEERQRQIEPEKLDYDDLQNKINEAGVKLARAGFLGEVTEVVERHLGKGVKVTEASVSQVDALAVILLEIEELSIALLPED